jgi:hypothetical protein
MHKTAILFMPFCINAAKTWNILAFQSFHFKHTKFDIYVFLEWHFNLSNIIFVSFNPSLSLETQFLTKVMLLMLKLYKSTSRGESNKNIDIKFSAHDPVVQPGHTLYVAGS